MRQFKTPGSKPETQLGLSRGERRKFVLLTLALIFVVAALGTTWMKSQQFRAAQDEDLPGGELGMEETLLLPEVDAARLDELVRDGDPADRVMLDDEALDELLGVARTLTQRHFEAMETAELDAATIGAIVADPTAHRGQAFLARGLLDSIRTRRRDAIHPEEFIGRLILEDGSAAYFVTLEVPDAEELEERGGFLRVDGLFMKVFSDEDASEPGTWLEAPLLVGPRAIRSYRALGEVTEPHWALYEDVEDADLVPADGSQPRAVRETPFDALWHLMAYARDLPEDAVDWDATPLLDDTHLRALVEDPATWRAQPFRIPISRIQDARVLRATENPARIEHYTQGWIGNTTWKNVVHFKYPVEARDLRLQDYAYGQGFFLHDFAYESAGRGLRVAPVFVLHSLTRLEPEADPIFVYLGYVVAGVSMLLLVLFAYLLGRDRRRSEALQREMVRRRQARRRAQGTVSSPSS